MNTTGTISPTRPQLYVSCLAYSAPSQELMFGFVQLSAVGNADAGVAFHCYSGSVGAMTNFHNTHPTSGIWFSKCHTPVISSGRLIRRGWDEAECAGTVGSDWWGDLKWQTSNLWVGSPNNWARSALMWSFAADPNGVGDGIPHGSIIGCNCLFRARCFLEPALAVAEQILAAGVWLLSVGHNGRLTRSVRHRKACRRLVS
jgi:hypothetical protein